MSSQNCAECRPVVDFAKGNPLLSLYINRVITKKFPIKTFLEMIDSGLKILEEVEYDKQNSLNIKNPQFGRKIQREGNVL